MLDHLWLRVADLRAATRFYVAVAPAIAHSTSTDDRLTTVRGEGASLSLLEGEPTRNVHLAFGAPDRETVERFHAAGVAAGFESLGAPASGPSITPATSAHISPIPTAT